MDRELIDKVWKYCLPKEFKEEVKRHFFKKNAQSPFSIECDVLCKYFGHHNLTSDAVGEDEMLCVGRKQIDALQCEIFKAIMDAHDADDWQDAAHYILDVMPRSFAALFGSECIPNKDPKPVEPKFNVKIIKK